MNTHPSANTPPPKTNHMLASLPDEDYQRLLPHLESVALPLGWSVYESGSRMEHVYFLTDGIVSLLYVMENGESAEIAITGTEGLVGISLFMGGESTTSRAVVQSAGNGYRLKAKILKREFALGGNLQHLALRYTQALITQMTRSIEMIARPACCRCFGDDLRVSGICLTNALAPSSSSRQKLISPQA